MRTFRTSLTKVESLLGIGKCRVKHFFKSLQISILKIKGNDFRQWGNTKYEVHILHCFGFNNTKFEVCILYCLAPEPC